MSNPVLNLEDRITTYFNIFFKRKEIDEFFFKVSESFVSSIAKSVGNGITETSDNHEVDKSTSSPFFYLSKYFNEGEHLKYIDDSKIEDLEKNCIKRMRLFSGLLSNILPNYQIEDFETRIKNSGIFTKTLFEDGKEYLFLEDFNSKSDFFLKEELRKFLELANHQITDQQDVRAASASGGSNLSENSPPKPDSSTTKFDWRNPGNTVYEKLQFIRKCEKEKNFKNPLLLEDRQKDIIDLVLLDNKTNNLLLFTFRKGSDHFETKQIKDFITTKLVEQKESLLSCDNLEDEINKILSLNTTTPIEPIVLTPNDMPFGLSYEDFLNKIHLKNFIDKIDDEIKSSGQYSAQLGSKLLSVHCKLPIKETPPAKLDLINTGITIDEKLRFIRQFEKEKKFKIPLLLEDRDNKFLYLVFLDNNTDNLLLLTFDHKVKNDIRNFIEKLDQEKESLLSCDSLKDKFCGILLPNKPIQTIELTKDGKFLNDSYKDLLNRINIKAFMNYNRDLGSAPPGYNPTKPKANQTNNTIDGRGI